MVAILERSESAYLCFQYDEPVEVGCATPGTSSCHPLVLKRIKKKYGRRKRETNKQKSNQIMNRTRQMT